MEKLHNLVAFFVSIWDTVKPHVKSIIFAMRENGTMRLLLGYAQNIIVAILACMEWGVKHLLDIIVLLKKICSPKP